MPSSHKIRSKSPVRSPPALCYSGRRGRALPKVSRLLALLNRMGAVELRWADHGHRQADALGRQNLPPPLNELLVCAPDRPNVAVEIIKTKRVDVAVLLAKGAVPVDLVRQRVPREAHDRHARVTHAQNIGPFLPEPVDSLVAVRPLAEVRLGVHHRQLVALVVLLRDLGIAEHLTGSTRAAIGRHPMLISDVIVV